MADSSAIDIVKAGDTVTCQTLTAEATGEADLYFNFDGYLRPCPIECGDDVCSFTVNRDGVLIVDVWAYETFTNVGLECTCESGEAPVIATCEAGGLKETLTTWYAADSHHLEVLVNDGDTVTCRTSGGTGDADIYMYFDSNRGIDVCSSTGDYNEEECTTRPARAEDGASVIVEIFSYEAYSDVEIVCFCNGMEPPKVCPERGSSIFFGDDCK